MKRKAKRKNSIKIDNTGDIDLIVEKNKSIQDILGFSKEKITDLFTQGIDLLHQGRYDEAAKAFSMMPQEILKEIAEWTTPEKPQEEY